MRFLRDKQISTLSPIPVSNGTQEIEGWDCNACFGKIVIWLYVPPLVAGDCMVLCVFFMFLCSKDWVRSVRLPVKSDRGFSTSRKQGVRSVRLPVKSDRGCQLVESKGDSLPIIIITLYLYRYR